MIDKLAVKVAVAATTVLGGLALAAPASAAVTASGDADEIAAAATKPDTRGAIVGASFDVRPPSGSPTAVSDSELALFPLNGPDYAVLSSGDATAADDDNNQEDSSAENDGDGDGHGSKVNDLVTLRIDLDVPESRNCLTLDIRFLTEEFSEFIGSGFNDAFLAELDPSEDINFQVADSGEVTAPANFAFDPDGEVVTVNAVGTSADNALGTTYDGATPILRATTPITPGAHSLYLSIYDVNDSLYDSSVFVDNLRLRNAKPSNCTRGSANNENADDLCANQKPTIFASDGVATGTQGDDVIQGSDANDKIRGKGGDDLICAAPGADKIFGGAGNDRLIGNSGRDEIKGNKGKDRIFGKKGDDTIKGQAGGDQLKGGSSDDRVFGGNGRDVLFGNRGDDVLRGRGGRDRLLGGRNEDTLRGGKGNDFCRGGKGRDTTFSC